jgi:hypothetical protein
VKGVSSVVTTPTEARAAQANAASKVVATPTELRAAQDPPDREERRSIVYTPTQATQGTPREEREDPEPTPKVVQTPGPTLTPSPRDAVDDSGKVIPTATPGPDTQSIAAVVTQTPEMPEGYVAPGVKDLPFTLGDIIRWDARALKIERGFERGSKLVVKELDGGYLSVSAPAGAREELKLAGTRYLPSTVAEATGSSLLRSSVSKASLITAALATIGTNLNDYGLGEHKDEGVGSQEFWVSTGVDLGLAVGTGFVAAVVVAGAVSIGIVSAPAALVVVGMLAVGISLGIDWAGVPDALKEGANEFINEDAKEWQDLTDGTETRAVPKAPPPVIP